MRLKALSVLPRRGGLAPFFFVLTLAVYTPCFAQKVTILGSNLPIDSIIHMVQRQTGYKFEASPDIFRDWPGVDLRLINVSLRVFLDSCFAGLNFQTSIEDKTIVVIRDPWNGPLYLRELSNKTEQEIVLQQEGMNMDEVVILGHHTTTRRDAYGTSYTLKNRDISVQHLTNPLDLLQARVPGLSIVRSNGYSESDYTVLLRGRRSIGAGNSPLYIVDGLPVFSGNFTGIIGPGSPMGGTNPLNGISPEDIETMTVLSGPGATAEYGSRAANGVVLISLKKGLSGRLRVTAGVSYGPVWSVKGSHLLNTQQFLQLRKEAVANDGLTVDTNSVPELRWDNSRYSNFSKLVLGNKGRMQMGHIGLTGGSSSCSFLLSGNTSQQSTVLPGKTSDSRQSVYGYLRVQSADSRFKITVSGLYSWQAENLPLVDLTGNIYLAPNTPAFYDADHQPVWRSHDVLFNNIYALENNTYTLTLYNFLGQVRTSWQIRDGLYAEVSLGNYVLGANERGTTTIAGQAPDPTNPPTAGLSLGTNESRGTSAEGVVHYSHDWGPGLLEAFAGGTWQGDRRNSTNTDIEGLMSDLQLTTGNMVPARFSSNQVNYDYAALFGQCSYNLYKKYILSFTGRRDGSSRWSKGNRYGNFASINGSWVFGENSFFKDWRWLKLGKLRFSWGTVGNDQIPDYQYARSYANVSAGGQQGLQPTSLYNPGLKWELYRNEELALDLGFLENKLGFSAVAYRTWSANQLVESRLAGQAGEPGIFNDLPIKVQNEGLELVVRANLGRPGSFRWGSSLSLTIPRNKLVSYPGLANSSNATTYVEGKSLSVSKGFHYTGVNDTTGLYTFEDRHKDGVYDYKDFIPSKSRDPRCYGAWSNNFSYRQWQLDLVFSFNFQNGYDPLVLLDEQNLPGAGAPAPSQLSNGPIEWLHRWQKPGDHSSRQRLTSMLGTPAAETLNRYITSDAAVIDASYGRLKTVSLSWQLPEKKSKDRKLKGLQIYIRGHDILTIKHYPVTDPETQNPNVLPLSKSWQAGFTITF